MLSPIAELKIKCMGDVHVHGIGDAHPFETVFWDVVISMIFVFELSTFRCDIMKCLHIVNYIIAAIDLYRENKKISRPPF